MKYPAPATQPVGLGTLRIEFPFDVLNAEGINIGNVLYVELGSAGIPLPGVNLHFEGCGIASDDREAIREKVENVLLSEYIRRLVVVTR